MRSLRFLLPLALACRAADLPAPPAKPHAADELQLPPDSPKLSYLSYDTVRVSHEVVVAILPAQLVMDEDHTVRVRSPVAGRVLELLASVGTRVRAGTPLALIASSDLAQAASDAHKAQAALTLAEAAVTRARDLYTHQVISQKELQQAESDAATARAEADRANARTALLGTAGRGGAFVLRAPIGGEIVERNVNPGTELREDVANPLFVISALDTLWLSASLYQEDAARVQVGDRLEFRTDARPEHPVTASITWVSGTLDPETRTVQLRAAIPNRAGEFKPAMYGEARLLAQLATGRTVVPTTALVTDGPRTVVFVRAAPGRFLRRAVALGGDDGREASVTAGLSPGDVVVARGSVLLAAELEAGS